MRLTLPALPLIAVAAALAFAALAAPATAQEKEPFTMERFEALQEEGALILVDVFASWCPTCRRQQEILSAFQEAHPDVTLYRLTVDFDDQKAFVRHFRAPRQSTLILYRGDEQVWFSVAETNRRAIYAAINEAAAAL